MRKQPTNFVDISHEIARVTAVREQLVQQAFDALERSHPTLARMLLEIMGSRQRAACWMCSHQRAFDGTTAYALLAQGDEDRLWDHLPGNSVGDAQLVSRQPRMAY